MKKWYVTSAVLVICLVVFGYLGVVVSALLVSDHVGILADKYHMLAFVIVWVIVASLIFWLTLKTYIKYLHTSA